MEAKLAKLEATETNVEAGKLTLQSTKVML